MRTLSLIAEFSTVRVPLLRIPPPSAPELASTKLLRIVEFVTVRVPPLWIPPPSSPKMPV